MFLICLQFPSRQAAIPNLKVANSENSCKKAEKPAQRQNHKIKHPQINLNWSLTTLVTETAVEHIKSLNETYSSQWIHHPKCSVSWSRKTSFFQFSHKSLQSFHRKFRTRVQSSSSDPKADCFTITHCSGSENWIISVVGRVPSMFQSSVMRKELARVEENLLNFHQWETTSEENSLCTRKINCAEFSYRFLATKVFK